MIQLPFQFHRALFRNMAICLFTAALVRAADDRAADRAAIRAHIDRIFQAFIHKDAAELRATHDKNWLGYLEGSDNMIRGVGGYMEDATYGISSPDYGMTGYKIREFDMIFEGNAAFVAFVADVDSKTPAGTRHRTLRITDFYVRQNGQWIQAGSNTDEHPESMRARVRAHMEEPQTLSDADRKSLLGAREAVWRAFFANDKSLLDKLIPQELVTIEAGGDGFGTRNAVMAGSEEFAKSGGKLTRLEFPKTEIQSYGSTAIVYSTYLYEIERNGQRIPSSGRVTEVFVRRNGQWVNPGWHMDSGK
jgi:ketosteroid isomerase-like protein